MADQPDPTRRPDEGSPAQRREDEELVTGGKPLVDDDVLDQPTDEVRRDPDAGIEGEAADPRKLSP